MAKVEIKMGEIGGGGGITNATVTSSGATYTEITSSANTIIDGELVPSADIQPNTTFATVSPAPSTSVTGEAWLKNDTSARRTITIDTSGNMSCSPYAMGGGLTWKILVLYES